LHVHDLRGITLRYNLLIAARRCILRKRHCYFPSCGQAVYLLWWSSLTKGMQTEQLLCWSGMTDTEHISFKRRKNPYLSQDCELDRFLFEFILTSSSLKISNAKVQLKNLFYSNREGPLELELGQFYSSSSSKKLFFRVRQSVRVCIPALS